MKKIIIILSLLVIVIFIIVVINQTAQFLQLCNNIHPGFGKIVYYGIIIIYSLIVLIPIYLFLVLPKPLRPPAEHDKNAYDHFIQLFAKRLQRNTELQLLKLSIKNKHDIEQAIKILNGMADKKIKETASTIFLTTAISQSGRFDALTVLISQSRMVWQLAHIYNQRPSLREMVQLYANIGVTVFLSMELDDIDIEEQVEPVLENLFGGAVISAIPGGQLIANSIFSGTANAFLTLRIGALTKRYCGSLKLVDRKSIRNSSTIEAGKLLLPTIGVVAKKLKKTMIDVVKNKIPFLGKNHKASTKDTQHESADD
jgi:hypothetical protein